MIYPPTSTSKSIVVSVFDDSGLAVTGLVAATFPAVYWSISGNTAATAITLSDLALITTAWTSGGIKERAAGRYRLDIPDAALATAGDLSIYGEASGKHLLCAPITVGNIAGNMVQIAGQTASAAAGVTFPATVGTSTLTDALVWSYATRLLTGGANIVLAKGVGLTGLNDIAAGAAMTLTAAYDAAKTAGTSTLTAAQVWTHVTRELTAGTNIILAKGVGVTGFNDIAAGAAMTLTTPAQNALVAAIEVELANDATGQALMQAIANKLTATLDIDAVLAAAIANACRDAILNRSLAGNHDTAGTVGKLLQALPASGTVLTTLGTVAPSWYTAPDNSTLALMNTEVNKIPRAGKTWVLTSGGSTSGTDTLTMTVN